MHPFAMDSLAGLALAMTVFVGAHLLLSHPLRAPLVGAMGERAFQGLYSVLALGAFFWAVLAYRGIAPAAPFWTAPDWLWMLATLIMWFAAILLAGSLFANPASPLPGAAKAAAAEPQGVYAITRHPMMWSFILWGAVHLILLPNPKDVILAGGIILLALAGSLGQDAKKTRTMGEPWRVWRARTSHLPFARQISGSAAWSAALPGTGVLLLGTLLWLLLTWAHGPAGVPEAGPWRWL